MGRAPSSMAMACSMPRPPTTCSRLAAARPLARRVATRRVAAHSSRGSRRRQHRHRRRHATPAVCSWRFCPMTTRQRRLGRLWTMPMARWCMGSPVSHWVRHHSYRCVWTAHALTPSRSLTRLGMAYAVVMATDTTASFLWVCRRCTREPPMRPRSLTRSTRVTVRSAADPCRRRRRKAARIGRSSSAPPSGDCLLSQTGPPLGIIHKTSARRIVQRIA
mmetsp:Transcript_68722/g.191449  ORF Transcript_68722/g.191449 Transcript_68722/m.191449 type:complete len:219 (+) Transcript_68722:220-876(+)